MVQHLVLIKPRADLTSQQKKALIDAFKRAVAEIPTVKHVRVGRRIVHGASYERATDTVDFLIALDFDDLAGLQAYLRHPAHEELGERFGQSISSAWVCDFEVGGVEQLDALA